MRRRWPNYTFIGRKPPFYVDDTAVVSASSRYRSRARQECDASLFLLTFPRSSQACTAWPEPRSPGCRGCTTPLPLLPHGVVVLPLPAAPAVPRRPLRRPGTPPLAGGHPHPLRPGGPRRRRGPRRMFDRTRPGRGFTGPGTWGRRRTGGMAGGARGRGRGARGRDGAVRWIPWTRKVKRCGTGWDVGWDGTDILTFDSTDKQMIRKVLMVVTAGRAVDGGGVLVGRVCVCVHLTVCRQPFFPA